MLSSDISSEHDKEILSNKNDVVPQVFLKSFDDTTYLIDVQSGNYLSNQSIFQGSQTVGDAPYFWYDAKFLIPGVTLVTYSVACAQNVSPYTCAPKANNACLVDSCIVQINGVTVNNQTSGISTFVHFKHMIEFGAETMLQKGVNLGFIPDTAESRQISTTATYNYGNFDSNITTTPAIAFSNAALTQIFPQNAGLLTRQLKISSFVNGTTTLTNAQNNALMRNYYVNTTTTTVGTYFWMAEVRLRDICPFFKVLDFPIKNLQPTITLNLNQGSTIATQGNVAVATNIATLPVLSVGSLSQSTMPWMLTSVGAGAMAKTATCTVSLGVGNTNVTGVAAFYPSIRLVVPKCVVKDEQYQMLFTGTKELNYRDVIRYTLLNQVAGNINWNITQGLNRIKRIIIVPFLSLGAAISSVYPSASLFDAAPCMTAGNIGYSNIILTIGGAPLYMQNEQYDYTQFNHVTMQTLDGGLSDNIGTGLISRSDWEKAYHYLVFDCSRLSSVSLSSGQLNLQVTLTLPTATITSVDLHAFIEYERTTVLDCNAGIISSIV